MAPEKARSRKRKRKGETARDSPTEKTPRSLSNDYGTDGRMSCLPTRISYAELLEIGLKERSLVLLEVSSFIIFFSWMLVCFQS